SARRGELQPFPRQGKLAGHSAGPPTFGAGSGVCTAASPRGIREPVPFQLPFWVAGNSRHRIYSRSNFDAEDHLERAPMPNFMPTTGRMTAVARASRPGSAYYVMVLGVVFMLAASSAFAHHSHAMFDLDKQVTLVGTVKEFQWNNPHCWIQLLVPDP